MRAYRYLTCACALIVLPTVAQAGISDPQAQSADPQVGSGDRVTPPGSVEADIPDIIVTAQHRSESVQNAPVTISVLSGADLIRAGATDVRRVADLIPGVQVITTGLGGAQVAVRGIVNNNVNVGSDPSLIINVDDVYIARSQSALASFYDVERIEVLKGPQGTLYGRNSISGALNILTRDPTHDLAARGSVEFGNYGEHIVEGALNVPIGSSVAVRVAGQLAQHDGYTDHYWNNQDDGGVRAKLLADVTDRLQILISGSYAHIGGHGFVFVNYPFVGDPYNPNLTTKRGTAFIDDDVYNASARINWDLGFGKLTYIHGYSHLDENYSDPPAGGISVLKRQGTSDEHTDELRLSSHTAADAAGRVAWVGGVYRYREDQTQNRHLEGVLPFGTLIQDAGYPTVVAESYAAFAQGTYAVTDHFRLTGGIRGTHEKKTATGSNVTTINGNTRNTPTAFNQSSSVVNYRAVAEYDVTPHSMIYASVTTGFHGGGWQDGSGPVDSTYQPEKLRSYELGSKNEFFNRHLRVNLDAYYYDYTNFLVGVSDTLSPTCACSTNAPKARAYGIEVEGQVVATRRDRFTFNFAFEDTDYSDFKIFLPFTTNLPGGKPIPASGTQPAGVDYSGTSFPFVSKFSGTTSYQHSFPLKNGGEVVAYVASYFRTSYGAALGNQPDFMQGGYTKTDFNLTYHAPRRWSVSAFVRNIEDTPAVTSLATQLGGGRPYTVGLGQPRTFGGRLEFQL